MFNKIAIVNDKIRIMRGTVTWIEQRPKVVESGEIEDVDVEHSADVADVAEFLAYLDGREISYTVVEIDVPEYLEVYDGVEWLDSRSKALEMINKEVGNESNTN